MIRYLCISFLSIAFAAGASAQTPEQKIAAAIEGQTYSHRINDTRDNRDPILKAWIGKAGVEYLLDNARLTGATATVRDAGGGLLNKNWTISVRSRITGAAYQEKHFRGIGHEYHTKEKHSPSAEIEFIFRLDQHGLRPLDAKVLNQAARGRALEQLRNGGTAKVLERLKTAL